MENLMSYCNNYFYRFKEFGVYNIENNRITIRGRYLKGQYVRIIGSFLNDGVYKVVNTDENTIILDGLKDEEFEGYVCSLSVPKSFVELDQQIKRYKEENKPTAMISESFGNYSYSKATNKNGAPLRWQDVFKDDLKQYRKIYDDFYRVTEVF